MTAPSHARHQPRALLASLLATVLALAGCATAPAADPPPPAVDTPVAFKQGEGAWVPTASVEVLERGTWWELFGDPALNALAQQVEVSNQNLAAAVAAYAQARALVAQQRASLFPSVNAGASADRGGGRGGTPTRGSYDLSIGFSWEPDVWGRLGQAVAAARASEQASAADLAAARLSIQGELAANYIALRGIDQERALLRQIVQGLERTLQITGNRYEAGIVARTDVLQAQTQLANARAELLTLDRQRAQLEHAVAVLVGRAPGNFAIEDRSAGGSAAVPALVPDVPMQLPSTLLLRRPDIVGAERRVVLANAQRGVARSAWFPSLRLSGSSGLGAASFADVFSAGNLVWALGLSLAQTVFDGGAREAQLDSARAGLEQAAARYRQTVLSAFQGVEDQLVAARLLREQQALREQAASAAALAEQQVMNRYQAGQVGFNEVITAQSTAQNARRSLVQLQADRQLAAVALIQALGGGWRAP
ncbi:efflux transporter outer membrane subunit [Ramlibacter rhizophilus]|uniref:Efflux transporter outer membrane subunit n=1 Tax=Ramlibacter rhizophilus TaxID=1781167 RepID=A0A4Z0BDL4_9BURK|nr:efflux transporter outer membrane subunit [Ramlibacter rhizophilus]TFY96771.1 efflux transporter outer membrane subunit [Ramlibacter rhizophilus]